MNSSVGESDWKYPLAESHRRGMLTVSPPHRIYWEEYGNPQGEPVFFLHGGPGGATTPTLARFFNPARYRIVLFHQRGCGKSEPNAAGDDPALALANNTTPHLIADILALRRELGVTGRMHVFGGSWGSTLALAYAIDHSETVASLILRGIFLCRRKDLDYFYQGNAAHYDTRPGDTALPGAYLFFPQAWQAYVDVIPATERGDMIAAYAKHFAMTPANNAERDYLTQVAKAWSLWEGVTSHLEHDAGDLAKFADPEFARAFARIENHYFMHGAFLGGKQDREQNHILENVARLKDIPIHIVHGRYDQVCPLFQAEELVSALKAAGAGRIDYRVTAAGHSMMERANCAALTEIMDDLTVT